MSPELFGTYTRMRAHELRRTAEVQRLVAATAHRRRAQLFDAIRSWFSGSVPVRRDEVQACPTC